MTPQRQVDLGKRVEATRVERGWSREEAARRAGISAITWKRVEDGLKVHDSKLAAVLRVVDVDDDATVVALPNGVRRVGDPDSDFVEFVVEGTFGVRAVVKGPIRDIDELQRAVSGLIAGMNMDSAAAEGP